MDIKNISKYEENLTCLWFDHMKTEPVAHSEPILDEDTTSLMKNICFTFNYDDSVFVMSVEVLEELIIRSNMTVTVIENPLLNLFCVIYICGKFKTNRRRRSLTLEVVQRYLLHYSKKHYNLYELRAAEMNILKTLQFALPKYTKADDVNTMYLKLVHPLKVKSSVIQLCSDLLNLVILSWPTIYRKLKTAYTGTKEKEDVFRRLLANRCYIPSGVIFTGMRLIELFRVLDRDKIGMEVQMTTKIHLNHLVFLSDILHQIANKKKNRRMFSES